jgi:hypothetical protein
MKKPIQFLKLLFPILLFSAFFACKEKIEINNDDDGFPLNLRMEVNDETPSFSWDAANVSNFGGYTLVRSETFINPGQKPGFGGTTIIMQTNNADSVKVEDATTPFVTELYYKLYLNIGDRFIESQTVKLAQELTKFPFTADYIYFIPDSSWAVILTANQIKLTLYDYKEKEILATKTIGGSVSVTDISMTDAVENGKRVLYYFNSYEKLYKFDLKDFTVLKTTTVNTNCFSMVNNAGQIYSTHYDYDKSFSVRRTTDLSTTKNFTRSNYYDRRFMVVLDGATNRIGEISPYGITAFNINPTTSQASNTTTVDFTNFGNQLMVHLPISADKKFFVPKSDGQVYNTDLEAVTPPMALNSPSDFAFSLDGKFMYSLSFDFNFSGALITKFNFPEMTQVSSKIIGSISPRRIHAMPDGSVMFFGIDFSGTNTFVKKIKL